MSYRKNATFETMGFLKEKSHISSDDPQKTLPEITVAKARNAYECIKNKDMDKAKKFAKYKDDRKLIYDPKIKDAARHLLTYKV